MKKSFSKLAGSVLLFALLTTGCTNTNQKSVDSSEVDKVQTNIQTEEAEKSDKVKVTLYDSDGSAVLEEKEIEKGGKLEKPELAKEGYELIGWFATPAMKHMFDFDSEITEDLNLYAGFTKYVDDKREFYIIGNGESELLSKSNWGEVVDDEFKLKKSDSDKENIYTISVDLKEGDEFQFAINDSWENQRGFGYLDTIEKDGEEYFENSGGLGDVSVKRANIKVVKPGRYTFTLKTHPAEDYYDEKDESYTEEGKENFNLNPYDVISWTFEG